MKKHPWVEAERKFYEERFDEVTKEIDYGDYKTVLDYGSGTGGFASVLAERHPHLRVVAVDSNPEAIELAKQHYSHIPNLEFIVSEKIPDRKFDVIHVHLVLHELDGDKNKEAIQEYLKDARFRLADNGRISVLDNRKISASDYRRLYEKNGDPRKGTFDEEYTEHNRYSLKDWRAMFEGAGFKTEHEYRLKPNLFRYVGTKRRRK